MRDLLEVYASSNPGILRINRVPITAKIKVEYFDTGGAESGIATNTANSTKVHKVTRISGLIFFGIPLPSR